MNLDSLQFTLKKVQAILRAATPSGIGELNPEEISWLIHAASDYVQEALEELGAH